MRGWWFRERIQQVGSRVQSLQRNDLPYLGRQVLYIVVMYIDEFEGRHGANLFRQGLQRVVRAMQDLQLFEFPEIRETSERIVVEYKSLQILQTVENYFVESRKFSACHVQVRQHRSRWLRSNWQ